MAQSSVRPPANAVTNAPSAPGEARVRDAVAPLEGAPTAPWEILGPNSDSTLWGEVRQGSVFSVTIPDQNAATLVQSYGIAWQNTRSMRGPLRTYGTMSLFGIVALLFVFYLFRGRIRIEHGFSGTLIERFKPVERCGHWLLAGSFILLALTGLNLLYGRDLLIPLFGKETFAAITQGGKWVHNNVAWAFMLGLVMIFVMWVAHNLPSKTDLKWIAQGGGLFTEGVHPPARKFNAGQKLIFWAVILLGASVSLSGVSLLFPYELPVFATTFAILNSLGAEAVWGAPLATDLSPLVEMQYAQIWHTMVALAMIVVIVAHIYIGTLGMEGAFDAMGSGMVDRNWAEEHHGLWVEEQDAKAGASDASGTAAPAE
ncbi:MAG: formate dehydrogenase subunit gamma [Proteobacteria bacterium]|nr:formate dehydrogenase subunit gamma [Pseudomonadota bacterium]